MKTKTIIQVIGLAIALFGTTMAKANFTMGNTYGSAMTITYTEGNAAMQTINGAGGNFGGIGQASLDGKSLSYVYCIDLFDDIRLNTSYSTTVTTNETPQGLQAIEIKSGSTFASDWPTAVRKWQTLAGGEALTPIIIYGGKGGFERESCRVIGWNELL